MTQQEMEFSDHVDTLTNEQRIELRDQLKADGDNRYLLRSLYFNYTTQEWI